jgi:hypothetical protein
VDRDLGLESVNGSPVNHEELRAMLVLYSLLYEWLVIPDGASFFNLMLRDVLQGKEHRPFGLAKLLQDGVIVPVARDVAPSFVELEGFLFSSGAWRAPPREIGRRWAEFLDEHTRSRVLLNHEAAAELFSELIYQVMRDPMMTNRLGLVDLREDLWRYVDAREREYENGFARRSTLYEFADLLPVRDARSARQARVLGSALYHLTAAEALGLQCAMAGPYASVFGELNDLPRDIRQVMREAEHDSSDAARMLSFDPAHLARVDYEVISDIRRSQAFHDYLQAMEVARSQLDPVKAASQAQVALVDYFAYLEEPLVVAASSRGRRVRKLRRRATASSAVFSSGGVITSVVGLLVPGSQLLTFAGGFFWLFGEKVVNGHLQTRTEQEIAAARAEMLVPREAEKSLQGLPSLAPTGAGR